MRDSRSGIRARMAELAAALRQPAFDEAAFATAETVVQDISRGLPAPRSRLCTAANVQKLNEMARHFMNRDAQRGLLLARLSSVVAPRVRCHTRAAASQVERLTADAFYLCAWGYLRCRHCHEAKEAAERAMWAYRINAAPDDIRRELAMVEMAYGQIVFYRGNTERGLRIMARAADVVLHVLGDRRLYTIAMSTYAGLLSVQRKYRLALRALDEAIFYAPGCADEQLLIASILHNVSFLAAELGLSGALPCRNISRERLVQFELGSELPKSRYLTYALLKREGKYDEALSELYMIRQEFLDRGLPVVAAQAVVQIVELLIQLGRHAEARSVGNEALEILTSSGVEFDAAMLRALLAKRKLRRGR